MKFDFSVVIPFYNKSFELNLVLKGLVCQTYDKNKFEVIIVDDGSDNPIDKLIDKYSSQLNIRYIRLDHTGNRGRNRNTGAKEAEGEKVILLDGDVIPESNLLNAFFQATKENAKLVSVGFRKLLKEVDKNLLTEESVENDCELLHKLPFHTDSRFLPVNYEKNTGNQMEGKWQLHYTNCVCIPKKEYEAVGGFDEVFSENWGAEDVELGFRLYQNGCMIEMNENARGIHVFHPENWATRYQSMTNNYNIFIKMHKHWTVELFIKEFETYTIEMIQLHNKIKSRKFIVSDIQNISDVIANLPSNVLLCGIEDETLISSDKIRNAFIPESSIESDKIMNWIGIETEYKDNEFELAILSKKYKEINYGLFHMLYDEISRIAKKVIVIEDKQNITALIKENNSTPYEFPKELIFYVSPYENYSINKHFIHLAIALHKIGMKVGYNVYFDPAHETNPNQGVMHTINKENVDIIEEIVKHGLDFIGSKTLAIVDKSILKVAKKYMGPKILWDEMNYYNQEGELKEISALVDAICPRREGEMEIYPDNKLLDAIPVGIEKEKILKIKENENQENDIFMILWSDQFTDSYSHLGLILEVFTLLFKDKEDIRLKIIHTGENKIYHSYHDYIQNQSYNQNYQNLYEKYKEIKNIIFETKELSEEEYSMELCRCNCFIHLNSVMKINNWVLESVAFGKKPIILNNKNYDDYFSESECFKVRTSPETVTVGKKRNTRDSEKENKYMVDVPIKESLIEILQSIDRDRNSVTIENNIVNTFIDKYDWLHIATLFSELL